MPEIKTIIVDDEPLARQRLRRYLANVAQPFFVEEADSGLAAVTQIEIFRPDIIFLDVEMPGFSGFEPCAQRGQASAA